MIRAAAVYGLTFNCDPIAAVLDRPAEDLPIILAVQRAASQILEQRSREAARNVGVG